MSRFVFTTLMAIIAFFAIGFFLAGTTRLWDFTAFWTVYLTIVGCGIAFIQLQFFGPVFCRGRSGVALTFDDGPDPAVTPALLDLLKREGISAAFFCIGKNVAAHPAIARRIVEEGHLIANHTYHHFWWTAFMGRRRLRGEIELTQRAIVDATGITPNYMRPPMGMTNPHYNSVLKKLGMKMVGWDVRSLDTFQPPQRVIERVLKSATDGSIVLLHDGTGSQERMVEIVGGIVERLRARGFVLERLDRLIKGPLAAEAASSVMREGN